MTPAGSSQVADYFSLPKVGEEHHAWEVFGAGDQAGCLNFITPERVAGASRLVTEGLVVNLDLPLDRPQPQFWSDGRQPFRRHEKVTQRNRDDHLDGFYLQGSSQWDALRHYRYRQYGYFGGREDDALDERLELGVDVMAERGVVGRGVLLDVDGFLERQGVPVRHDERLAIDHVVLRETADAEGVTVEPGDVLLIRTGWLGWYEQLPHARRADMEAAFGADRSSFAVPGLDAGRDTIAWLWNHQVAAVAADNPALEALPYLPEVGWAHQRLLPLLGMPIGELWALDELAGHCRRLGRYTFLLSSSPLNIPGGVGSPPNAYALL